MFSLISRNKLSKVPLSLRQFSSSGSGDIRGAGGTFGKKEKAQEEQYFRQKEKEELAEFKKKLDEKDNKKSDKKTKPNTK